MSWKVTLIAATRTGDSIRVDYKIEDEGLLVVYEGSINVNNATEAIDLIKERIKRERQIRNSLAAFVPGQEILVP